MSKNRSAPLHLLLGLVIWSAWFVFLYAGLSLACEFAPPAATEGSRTWINGVMIAFAIVVTGGLLYTSYRFSRAGLDATSGLSSSTWAFLHRVSLSVYLVSAAAAFALVIPALFLPPCA